MDEELDCLDEWSMVLVWGGQQVGWISRQLGGQCIVNHHEHDWGHVHCMIDPARHRTR